MKKWVKKSMYILLVLILIGAGIKLLQTKKESDSNKLMLQELKEIYEYHTESIRNSEINIEAPIEQPETDLPKTLVEINPDYKGWLQIEGILSLPVVQGSDNEYYLDHNFYCLKSVYGTAYLDYRNRPDDWIQIIYGHNVTDGQMFAALLNYEDEVFLLRHPIVTYAGGDYQIIAAKQIDVSTAGINYWSIPSMSPSDIKNKKEILKNLIDEEVDEASKYIVLSTCIQDQPDQRFIVIGKYVTG